MAAVSSYQFGRFELDLRSYELKRDGQTLRLEKIPMELLIFLVEHQGELITRDQIIDKLWGKQVFLDTEQGINTAIRKVRQVLQDEPEKPQFLETVVGKGYRFVGNVTAIDGWLFLPRFKIARSRTARLWLFWTVSGLVVTGVILWTVWLRIGRVTKPATANSLHSIAVLPFDNLTGNPNQEYFVDGMTDELITSLARVKSLRVVSRTSSMHYKGVQETLLQMARELGVDSIVEGTVSRSQDRVRVTVQLIDAHNDRHLWAQDYDRSIRDVLSLQGEIARTVTDEIRTKLTPEELTSLSRARPVNPEAHDDYLRGRYLLGLAVTHDSKLDKRQYTELDIHAAIGHFKHAIENDNTYASAYAGLADAYILLGHPVWGGHSPKETLSDAKAAARRALELDPSLAEAHFSLAQTLEYDWNWSEAEKEYRLTFNLNPNYADAHLEYGRLVQALGRNDEAMTQMNYAMELDPFGIKTRVVVAYVTYASRQYDLAIEQFERLGDDWGMIWAYREKKMYPEAIAAWERWKASHPLQYRDPHPLATLAGIYGLDGRKREAEELIDELKETARHRYVSGFFFAEVYAGLGQGDQAVTWLERAYEEHDQWMVFVNSYPGLDRLRSEPRFESLLRRMNFPQ